MPTGNFVDDLILSPILWVQTEEDAITSWYGLGNRPNSDILAITSGGCTPLTFLALGAKSVVSVDVNYAQNMVLELKRASILALDKKEILAFWGIVDTKNNNEDRYSLVRTHLSLMAQQYWDNNKHLFTQKRLIEAGGMQGVGSELRKVAYEQYQLLVKLFNAKSIDEQIEIYENENLDSVALHVAKMRQKRAENFFGANNTNEKDDKRVANEMCQVFVSRFRSAIQNTLLNISPWASQMLLGTYWDNVLPIYLTNSGFENLKKRIQNIDIYTENAYDFVKSLPSNSLDGADISNISDLLSSSEFKEICSSLARVLKPGSHLVHRNLIWPKPYPAVKPYFVRDQALSAQLHKEDKSFIYSAFSVDILKK
ncbi:MAG: DUF3419 family protein [Candidatus Parabeggiatoa sp.]|nr:DUF3419 family protein [Candidatus Parabeggiatoa sp.]